MAKGNYTAFSDADIIIIIKETSERPMDRIIKYQESRATIDIEPRVYTMGEIHQMIMNNAGIIREIAEHAMLLGGDEKIINEIKQAAKQHNGKNHHHSL